MSSDDGFILRRNNQGKYVLHGYCASAEDYPPVDDGYGLVFDTLLEAMSCYNDIDGAKNEYRSEYGLTTMLDDMPNTNESESKMQTQKASRKPFHVDCVQVTAENMAEVAEWVKGEIRTDGPMRDKPYILVNVLRPLSDRQRQAYAGDWVLHAEPGFKVYTDKAFKSSFTLTGEVTVNVFTNAGPVPGPASQVAHGGGGGGGSAIQKMAGGNGGNSGFPHVE